MPPVPDVLAGAFTRRAALGAGWQRSAVDRRLRSGAWVAVRSGVFHVADAPPLARAAAVVLATGGVASHVTAARVHGLWVVDDGEWGTVPWATHRRSDGRLRVHRGDLDDRDVADVAGVRVTTVLRTIEDLCREGSRLQAVCAIESAVRLALISPEQLLALRRDADRRIRALAIECDGREFHDRPDAVYRDRWRANELARSWVVLRFTWNDVRVRPDYILATVRATIARQAS